MNASLNDRAWALPPRTQSLRLHHLQHLESMAHRDHTIREVIRRRAMASERATLMHHIGAGTAMTALFQTLPVVIHDHDLIAGHFGNLEAELGQRDWQAELDCLNQQLGIDPDPTSPLSPALHDRLAALHAVDIPVEGGVNAAGHHLPDYEQVLHKGLDAMADEADTLAKDQIDPERKGAGRAMAEALRAMGQYAARHADHADELAATAEPARADELRKIAAACRRVPACPAKTFRDAVQAIWFIYLGLNQTERPSANSCGHLDHLLEPYYRADREANRVTDAEAYELLAQLLLKFAGCARGQALTLGGGRGANQVTRLILRAAAELNIGEPIIALMVSDNPDPETLDLAVDVTRRASGQLSYYSWGCCRSMLVNRGLPETDQNRLAINSCMGVVPAGCEVSNMWAGITYLPAALELAIDGGRGRNGKTLDAVKEACREPEGYSSIDEIFAAYEAIVRFMVECVADRFREQTRWRSAGWPNPFVSGIIENCRETGLDRLAGGPRYHSAICEAFGWANVGDSLIAIEDLVFDRQLVSLREFLTVARNDWQGAPDLLARVRQCPKYGNGDLRADAMSERVLRSYIRIVGEQRRPGEHAEFLPSRHTHGSSGSRGPQAPVSLDGRRFGAAFNKQLGPSSWAAGNGPTAVVTSAARMPITQLTGGQALDLSLPPDMLDDSVGRENFRQLLQTYFQLGGGQLQVNCIDVDTLKAARANPDEYPDLLIRVGGHCDHFVRLNQAIQDDLINRVAAGL